MTPIPRIQFKKTETTHIPAVAQLGQNNWNQG